MTKARHHRIVATPTRARAAVAAQHVRQVLLFGSIGVLGLLAGVYLHFFA
jgi:hypothetical protein